MQWGGQVQCADQSTRASFQSHISLLIRFLHQHHHHHHHHVQQYHHLSSTVTGRTGPSICRSIHSLWSSAFQLYPRFYWKKTFQLGNVQGYATIAMWVKKIKNSKFKKIWIQNLCWCGWVERYSQGCISCGILLSGTWARGVNSEHMEEMEMFSCSPT